MVQRDEHTVPICASQPLSCALRHCLWVPQHSAGEFPQPEVPEGVYAIPTMATAGIQEIKNSAWLGSAATLQELPRKRRADRICSGSSHRALDGGFPVSCHPVFRRVPRDAPAKQKGAENPDPEAGRPAARPGLHLTPATLLYARGGIQGDPKGTVWLPNADVAKAWMEYVKTGTVVHPATPAAPFNVRVSVDGNLCYEITWDAEASLESGIGGFIVLRDGHGIARLPERPPDVVYGTPLFQGLSFHDTPDPTFPKMAYLDTSAKAGVSHKYTVIALNTAGVTSLPSDPVSTS